MKWYSIGSLSFPASWAAIVAAFAFALGYLMIRKNKQTVDLYSNAFFTLLLTWKLSVILFHFQTAIKNPLSIVYFNGGIKGYFLGVAAAFFYLFGIRRKPALQDKALHIEIWMFIIIAYELLYYILANGHILIGGFQLAGGVFFLLWMKRKKGQYAWSRQVLILFTSFQGFIYSLKGDLLSVPMITYIAGAIVLILAVLSGSEERRNE